jgi:hypothetical protein
VSDEAGSLCCTLTVCAMNEASSPWAVYQSPRSKTRTVSSFFADKDLKNLMNPPSSSTYVELEWRFQKQSGGRNTLSSGRKDIVIDL